uniref:Uncharacterized protein n=1 Tax=Steinernema glaseri TaxID=37863 RepID=A0A1I7ZJE4_9BILA
MHGDTPVKRVPKPRADKVDAGGDHSGSWTRKRVARFGERDGVVGSGEGRGAQGWSWENGKGYGQGARKFGKAEQGSLGKLCSLGYLAY